MSRKKNKQQRQDKVPTPPPDSAAGDSQQAGGGKQERGAAVEGREGGSKTAGDVVKAGGTQSNGDVVSAAAQSNPADATMSNDLSAILAAITAMSSTIQCVSSQIQGLRDDHEAFKKDVLEKNRPVDVKVDAPTIELNMSNQNISVSHPVAVQDEVQQPLPGGDNTLLREVTSLLQIVGDMIDRNGQFLTPNLLKDFRHMKDQVEQIVRPRGTSLPGSRNDLLHKLQRYENQLQSMLDEINVKSILQKYVDSGAVYLGRDYDLQYFFRRHPDVTLYVFSFKWEPATPELWNLFEILLVYAKSGQSKQPVLCVMFDMDQHSQRGNPYIATYLNGECICKDLLAQQKEVLKYCTAFASKYEPREKPQRKTHFEAPCPLAFMRENPCPKKNVSWRCTQCMHQLEFGFDGFLYCNCGAGRVENFQFRCNSAKHSCRYEFYEKKIIPDLLNNLKSFNGLTILILGETGVGKSTFINGFANYLQYETLEGAKLSDTLLSPVQSSFVVTDENFEQTTVTTGKEDNECHVIGQSATQGAKAHVFNYKGSVDVRLIDTPGIGDTRGIEQDKENFQNILAYISYFEEIHGICILLKPNNSRLTVMFEFCIKELLTHLHKNAAENIIFCFTNARNTNYRPGDTFPALKALLKANENVPLVLKKETVFCMDNESFRYLAAIKHGIGFSEEDDKTYGTSWERARGETNRMMTYISGLKAHKVKDTISINNVRRKILDLTKPLAEIAKHIDTTISTIEDHKEEIGNSEKSAADIYKMINIQVPSLERKNLPYPRTVCTSLNCSETHNLNGQNVKKFNIHCHEHCYLAGVQADIVNNPALKQCDAMRASGGASCSQCKCSWNVHMHVTYELVSVLQAGEDKSAKQRYQGITDCIKLKERALQDFERVVSELQSEKQEIIKASAQFGMFLKANSVIPYNDAMIAYLNLMIKVESEKAGQSQNYATVNRLGELKQRYQEEIDMIKSATAAAGQLESAATVTFNAVDQDSIMKNLFKLKHFGRNMEIILMQMENEKCKKVTFEESRYEVKSVGVFKSACLQVMGAIHFFASFVSVGRNKLPAIGVMGDAAGKRREPYQPLEYQDKQQLQENWKKSGRNDQRRVENYGGGREGPKPWQRVDQQRQGREKNREEEMEWNGNH